MSSEDRVLVVGGAGYIGAHVVKALLRAGKPVTVFDDLSTGSRDNLLPGAAFVEGDLLTGPRLAETLAAQPFRGVVHLAARKAAGESMQKPAVYAHHNVVGSLRLIEAALAAGVERFVFSSSAAVYGDPEYLPLDEAHPTRPANFYGYTKLCVEQHLEWFSRLRGLRVANLRYFNAVGFDPEGEVRGIERTTANLLPVIMEVLTGRRRELKVFGDDYPTRDGTCVRDYIHVTDLADAHVRAYEALGERTLLTCNLASESGATVLEMLKAVQEVTGRAVPFQFAPRRAGDPPKLIASAARARSELGWRDRHSDLATIIHTTWDVYRAQA